MLTYRPEAQEIRAVPGLFLLDDITKAEGRG